MTMDGRKKPKSEKWFKAMEARRGRGTNQFTKAKELGIPLPVDSQEMREHKSRLSRAFRHSEETKKQISESKRKYLQENPDKVPYKLNHSSNGRSYPEEYWKSILDNNNVKYEEQHPVGSYSLDFALPDRMIDLEIDGEQHYVDQRIVESDKRRTEYLETLGWTTIRVRWSEFKRLDDKESFVNDILSRLK